MFVCCRYENFLISQECVALQAAPLLSALVLIPVLQEGVVVLALGHILGGVALLGQLVVDQPELAALLPRGDAVEADVELGAVVSVGVPEHGEVSTARFSYLMGWGHDVAEKK